MDNDETDERCGQLIDMLGQTLNRKIVVKEPIAKLVSGDWLCHSSTQSFAIGSKDLFTIQWSVT